jgi:uncharacterized cysteine cluster protein YcgN (CxxCxxCC family)
MQKINLSKLSEAEWENLCDGCGRCCLHKVEDENSKVYFTNVACKYLIEETCSCSDYTNRKELVKNCLSIEKSWLKDTHKFNWLPSTCAYKLAFEGSDLPVWHPLISGDKNSVHYAGISIRGRYFSDENIDEDDFEDYIIDWVN